MITEKVLREKAANRYRDVLKVLLRGEEPFPLTIRLGLPAHSAPLGELRAAYEAIRSQSRKRLGFGYTVDWEVVETRRHTRNEVPTRLYFRDATDFFQYIGKMDESARILQNAEAICQTFPEAQLWCVSNIALLEKDSITISRALAVLRHLREHPFPGVFARQLPLPIPTKFVEREDALLSSLAAVAIPTSLRSEGTRFAERAGLLIKESLIEFMSLDETVSTLPFRHGMATPAEIAAKADFFAPFTTILVVENHVTFLTLPKLPRTLALMGHGFAVSRLAAIPWLAEKATLLYWGDIDVAGFSILARFRAALPSARSVLMDEATFAAHSQPHERASPAPPLSPDEHARLTPAEQHTLAQVLQTNRWVEQEHIPFVYAKERLERMAGLGEFF